MKRERQIPVIHAVAALGAAVACLCSGATAWAFDVELGKVMIHDDAATPGISGNGNEVPDPGERIHLEVELENTSGITLSNVTAELAVSFGGVSETVASSGYPDLPPGASAANLGPFEIPIRQQLECGSRLSLRLSVRSGAMLVGEFFEPLAIGQCNGQGTHVDPVSVGTPGMKDVVLLSRGDGFGLFYTNRSATFQQTVYQRLGPHGEPGQAISLGQFSFGSIAAGRRNYGLVTGEESLGELTFYTLTPFGGLSPPRSLGIDVQVEGWSLGGAPDVGEYGLAYTRDSDGSLRFARLDENGSQLSDVSLMSASASGSPEKAWVTWVDGNPSGHWVVIWMVRDTSETLGHFDLHYSRIDASDGTVLPGHDARLIRDKAYRYVQPYVSVSAAGSDVTVFWTDDRDYASGSGGCLSAICRGALYSRRLLALPAGGEGAEVRVSTDENAVDPSAVWDGNHYQVAWYDPLAEKGLLQRLDTSGTLVDANGAVCGQPCNEEPWPGQTMTVSPVLGRSNAGIGRVLRVGSNPRTALGRFERPLPIDQDLWVKSQPATPPQTINATVATEYRKNPTVALGQPGPLTLWSQGSSADSELALRAVDGSALKPAVTLQLDPSTIVAPLYPSNLTTLPGGTFVAAFTDGGSTGATRYLAGFNAQGQILYGPKPLTLAGPASPRLRIASSGSVVGIVDGARDYLDRPIGFALVDTASDEVLVDLPSAFSGSAASIAAWTGGFAISWTQGWRVTPFTVLNGQAKLQLRDTTGNEISTVHLTAPGEARHVAVAAIGSRLAVAYTKYVGPHWAGDAFSLLVEIRDASGAPLGIPIELDRIVYPPCSEITFCEILDLNLELTFTGHELLASWMPMVDRQLEMRWQRLLPDGSLIGPRASAGFFDVSAASEATYYGLRGQSDGYQFAFSRLQGQEFNDIEQASVLLERFTPPPGAWNCALHNTDPTILSVGADTQAPFTHQFDLGLPLELTVQATSGANRLDDPGDSVTSYAWYLNADQIADAFGPELSLSPQQLRGYGISTAGTFSIRISVLDSHAGLPREGKTEATILLTIRDVMPPTVTLTSPNGGQSWPVGSSQLITWDATDDVGIDSFQLFYTADYQGAGLTDWIQIDDPANPADVPGTTNSFTWNSVPNILSATARIRVVALDRFGNPAEDVSDQNLYFIQATTSAVRTLILVHLGRMDARYPGSSGSLLSKLQELASREEVSGIVLPLDNVPVVSAALSAWSNIHSSNPQTAHDEALAASAAIHGYLWAPASGQLSSVYTQARYLVLVGEDAVLPFYRFRDSTGVLPQSAYTDVSATSTVGAAFRPSSAAPSGYFLTDDYYAAPEPQLTQAGAGALWLPELSVGRLVQTPSEIEAQINRFIAQDGEVLASRALVSGYDFLVDSAQDISGSLSASGLSLDALLIGQSWSSSQLACRLLGQAGCSARPQLLSINGHANHHQLGAALGSLDAASLASAGVPLAGAVVWGMGCHSGLVVPESGEQKPLDVPQALARLGVVAQVGQSGFGWGFRHGIGLTERLMHDFSARLVSESSTVVGDVLLTSKQAYFLSAHRYDVFDEKVLQEATLYGLPMYRVVLPSSARSSAAAARRLLLEPSASGSGVKVSTSTSSARAVPGGLTALELSFDFGSDTLQRIDTPDGSYYELNGLTTSEIGNPLEPMFLYDSTLSGTTSRGILFTGGSYTEQSGFNPVVGVPQSSNADNGEGPLPQTAIFLPSISRTGRRSSGRASDAPAPGEARLAVSVGHYLGDGRHRLFDAMDFAAYYSNSPDTQPPTITDPGPSSALHQSLPDGLHFSVNATDNVKLYRVIVTYSDEQAHWSSLDLQPQAPGSNLWIGQLSGVTSAVYLVQAVDSAGNSTYLGIPTADRDGAGAEWGTTTSGPRLFQATAPLPTATATALPTVSPTATPTAATPTTTPTAATPTTTPTQQPPQVPAHDSALWLLAFPLLVATSSRRLRQDTPGTDHTRQPEQPRTAAFIG